jgi:hypothetical protein
LEEEEASKEEALEEEDASEEEKDEQEEDAVALAEGEGGESLRKHRFPIAKSPSPFLLPHENPSRCRKREEEAIDLGPLLKKCCTLEKDPSSIPSTSPSEIPTASSLSGTIFSLATSRKKRATKRFRRRFLRDFIRNYPPEKEEKPSPSLTPNEDSSIGVETSDSGDDEEDEAEDEDEGEEVAFDEEDEADDEIDEVDEEDETENEDEHDKDAFDEEYSEDEETGEVLDDLDSESEDDEASDRENWEPPVYPFPFDPNLDVDALLLLHPPSPRRCWKRDRYEEEDDMCPTTKRTRLPDVCYLSSFRSIFQPVIPSASTPLGGVWWGMPIGRASLSGER